MVNKNKDRDFKAVLKYGDGHQKGLLVANSYAEDDLNRTPFLTREQIRELMESIKTREDGDEYNRVIFFSETLRDYIANVQTIKTLYKNFVLQLNHILLHLSAHSSWCNALNVTISTLTPKQKEKLLESLLSSPKRIFIELKLSEDGYLTYDTSPETQKTLNKLKADVEEAQSHLKTMIKVGRDFAEKQHVYVESYMNLLDEYENELKQEQSYILAHSGNYYNEQTDDFKELIKDNIYFKPYEEIEIDKGFYNHLINKHLEGADYGEAY